MIKRYHIELPWIRNFRPLKIIKWLPVVVCFLFLFSESRGQQIKTKDKLVATAQKEFKVIGPGGGGGIFLPTVSPFDENLVLTHCDMTGAYISQNGGTDWRMLNLWTVPNDFEFDPSNRNTIYIATHGYRYSEDRGSGLSLLYRSEDRGKHWRIIYPDVSKPKIVTKLQGTDYLPSEIIEGAFDGSIEKVEVDPSDHKRIYLGLAKLQSYIGSNNKNKTPDTALLIVSPDYGKSWKLVAKIPGKNVKAIFPGKRNGGQDETIVFTESACAGIDETKGRIRLFPLPVKKVNVVEGSRNTLYIQSDFKNENGEIKGGMFVSKDRGGNWSQINNGLLKNLANGRAPGLNEALTVCATKPAVAYIGTTNPVKNEKGATEDVYCIFKTTNYGSSWKPVMLSSSPAGFITKNFKGTWMERSFDPGWGGSPINLGVAPGNPDVCYAGDARGYKTTNGGKTWEQIYSRNRPDGSFASNGLDVTTCYGIHFDPFDKNHFFICYTDIGLFHTFNGGASWYHSIKNVPADWQNTCYDVKFDPKIKGRVWAAWANAHDLPREKMFGRQGFEHFSGGIALSYDNGLTWNKSNKGIPENSICTNILLDTSTPVNSRTLYASVFNKGIYKSVDGGKSWQVKNAGLGDNLFAWQLRQNINGRLFVLCSRGQRNGQVVDGTVYMSDDDAATWLKLTLPHGVNGPHDLLVDPEKPDRMYISCWPRREEGNDVHGGVIKTEDGGLTWKAVFDACIRVNSAGMDPRDPSKIFINTFHNAAYASKDYGETWQRIPGYRFKWGQRAVPDINHPGMIYLTTYGGSVFYGPEKGATDELIENMPAGWW
ncbi:MAG: hypothetical protein ABI416_00420 [Ginsengibacter sp.]